MPRLAGSAAIWRQPGFSAVMIRSMVATKETPANKDLLEAIITEQTSNFINTRFIF